MTNIIFAITHYTNFYGIEIQDFSQKMLNGLLNFNNGIEKLEYFHNTINQNVEYYNATILQEDKIFKDNKEFKLVDNILVYDSYKTQILLNETSDTIYIYENQNLIKLQDYLQNLGDDSGNFTAEIRDDENNYTEPEYDAQPNAERGFNAEPIADNNQQSNTNDNKSTNAEPITNFNENANENYNRANEDREFDFGKRIADLLNAEPTRATLRKIANRFLGRSKREINEPSKQPNSSEFNTDNEPNSINQSKRSDTNGQLLSNADEPSQAEQGYTENNGTRSDDGRRQPNSSRADERTSGEFGTDGSGDNQPSTSETKPNSDGTVSKPNQNDKPTNADNFTTTNAAISQTGQGDNAEAAIYNEPNDELSSSISNSNEQEQINPSQDEPNDKQESGNAEFYNEPSNKQSLNRADDSGDNQTIAEQSANQSAENINYSVVDNLSDEIISNDEPKKQSLNFKNTTNFSDEILLNLAEQITQDNHFVTLINANNAKYDSRSLFVGIAQRVLRQNLTIENKKIIQDEKLKLYKDYVEQTEPNGFRKQIFDIVTQIHTLQGYYDKPQSQNEIANSNNEVKQNNSVENEIIDNAFEENLSAENYTNKSEQEQQGDQEVEKETITKIESQDEIDTSKHFLTYTYEQFQVKYENLPSYKEQFDFNLTKKERIEANFEALELMQIILKRDEPFATEQEQEILAKFSGYGGLKTLFVDDKYETDRLRLENLVGKENYENLMQSSETAFYTPDDMIVRMYQGLTQMGVTYKDRVYALEPSCGIGKFISLAPANFEFEAVEKDTLTATIAKMLHPNVKIYNCGFEEVETYRQYDVVVGNPPFSGDIKIHDSRSRASGMSIHNYFAVRSAELLKEGGILNFVTSSYFLDSISNRHRELMSNQGKFISAFRLPSSAFGSSHTEVLTDVFYYTKLSENELKKIKKEPNPFLNSQNFLRGSLDRELSINLNSYYDIRAQNMLGIASISENNPFHEPRLALKEYDERRWQDELTLAMRETHNKIADISSTFSLSEPFVDKTEQCIPFNLMDDEKIEYIKNLNIGSIYEFDKKFYVKSDISMCHEVYFIDELPLDKMELVAPVNIIETKKTNFTYKSYLNTDEFVLCQKIVDFRDRLKFMLDNEKTLPNDEENNNIINAKKRALRDLRKEILDTAKVNFFNSRQQKKRDSNGKITMHTLSDIINLDEVNCFKIYATENEIKINDKKTYEPSDILNKRVLFAREITRANNPTEVLAKSINDFGKIRTDFFTTYLPSMSEEEITQELVDKRLIFRKFDNSGYELASQFLSGNVKEKYKICQEMIDNNITFSGVSLSPQEIMAELAKYFPKYIPYEDLEVNFGANYISTEIYEKFIRETFFANPQNAVVEISYFNGTYSIENFQIVNESSDDEGNIIKTYENATSSDLNDNALNIIVRNENGEIHFNTRDLIELVINNKSLEVKHYEKDKDDPTKTHIIIETIPTRMSMDNAEIIKELFDSFCFNDESIREQITQSYNDKINVYANKTAPYGDYLTMPNLNDEIKLRPHQKDVVYKGVLQNSLMLDHQVGAGKTFASIVLAMEQKRMGLVNKPLILVPNHMSRQWATDFFRCYPSANILVGDSINSKKARKEFLYKARFGEFDAIIMKHSTFENMNVMQSFQEETLGEELEKLEKKLNEKVGDRNNQREENKFTLQLIAQQKKLKNKLKKLAEGKKFDSEIAFEDLGIDALFVDEAQNFKNLFITTNLQGIKGLSLTDSQKAMKMFCATRYCHQNGYKLYFMTGTPVSNSISEFFIMQTYLQPQLLEKMGLTYFDDWQKVFTLIAMSEELDSSGVNYKIVSRLSKFVNVPELMNLYKQNVDIITNEDIEKKIGRFVPKIKGGNPTNIIVPRTENIANFIGIEDENGQYNKGSIIWRMDNLRADPKKNNMLACTTDARKAALDYRMIEPTASDEEITKTNEMIKRALQHYNDKNYPKNTQLIFCDMGVSKQNSQKINVNDDSVSEFDSFEMLVSKLELEMITNDNGDEVFVKFDKNGKIIKSYTYEDLQEEQGDKFDIYADILKKLVKAGIPQKQIAFIGDAKTDKQKQDLFDKVNNGDIRFIIGSTSKMGAGTNIQKRVVAMHELDCPWRPCDLEQRQGRVIRQGNMWFENDPNFEMACYRYATEQTYDARMFQVNEQKLRPLAQIKKGDFSDGTRVFDSIDSEIANIADMKAFATGNMFVLEKHKIATFLDTENRFYDNFKRQILANQNKLKNLSSNIKTLSSEIKFLENVVNIKINEYDNYEIKAFGIETTKKAKGKNDEEAFKARKEKIINELTKFAKGGEKSITALEIKGIKVSLEFVFFSDIEGKKTTFIRGVMSDKNGNEFRPQNLMYKQTGLFADISYDGLIQKVENLINKANILFTIRNNQLVEFKSSAEICERFLAKNSLENYDRAGILKLIKQDEKNINEIFRIRNELRTQGIIINNLSAPQISHLVPKYPLITNKNGKLVPNLLSDEILQSIKSPMQNLAQNAEKEVIKKIVNESENIAKDSKTSQDETKINEPQEKLKSMCKEDVLPGAEPNTNEIEIKEFSNSMSIEERLKILQVNQTNLKKTKHSKKILE